MMFLDDNGIWRYGGHLHNADLPYDVLHPIRRAHQRVMHSSIKDTLTEFQSKYWIPQGESLFPTVHWSLCAVYEIIFCFQLYSVPSPPPLPGLSDGMFSYHYGGSGLCWSIGDQTLYIHIKQGIQNVSLLQLEGMGCLIHMCCLSSSIF